MLEQERIDPVSSLEVDEVTRARDDLEFRTRDARVQRVCNAVKIRGVAFADGDQRWRGHFG